METQFLQEVAYIMRSLRILFIKGSAMVKWKSNIHIWPLSNAPSNILHHSLWPHYAFRWYIYVDGYHRFGLILGIRYPNDLRVGWLRKWWWSSQLDDCIHKWWWSSQNVVWLFCIALNDKFVLTSSIINWYLLWWVFCRISYCLEADALSITKDGYW